MIMKRVERYLLLAAALLAAPRCGGPPGDDEALVEEREAITNGAVSTGDGAVVALVENGQVGCTGTLVAPRLVLTAAHCQGAALARLGAGEVPVSGRRSHPGYSPLDFTNDVALLVLASPSAVAPVPMARSLASLTVDARVRVVGFGEAFDGDGGEARRLTGISSVRRITADSLELVQAPSQPCRGDSGGPVLVGDELVAVVASGDGHCDAYATATRIDAVRDFVDPAVAAMDGCLAAAGCWPSAGADAASGAGCGVAGRAPPGPGACLLAVALAALLRRRRCQGGGLR
jgi:secreted trypsin-like serine protease